MILRTPRTRIPASNLTRGSRCWGFPLPAPCELCDHSLQAARHRGLHRVAVERLPDVPLRRQHDQHRRALDEVGELADGSLRRSLRSAAVLEVLYGPPGERDAGDVLAGAGRRDAAGRRTVEPGPDLRAASATSRKSGPGSTVRRPAASRRPAPARTSPASRSPGGP